MEIGTGYLIRFRHRCVPGCIAVHFKVVGGLGAYGAHFYGLLCYFQFDGPREIRQEKPICFLIKLRLFAECSRRFLFSPGSHFKTLCLTIPYRIGLHFGNVCVLYRLYCISKIFKNTFPMMSIIFIIIIIILFSEHYFFYKCVLHLLLQLNLRIK